MVLKYHGLKWVKSKMKLIRRGGVGVIFKRKDSLQDRLKGRPPYFLKS